jgi:hypothetical protein
MPSSFCPSSGEKDTDQARVRDSCYLVRSRKYVPVRRKDRDPALLSKTRKPRFVRCPRLVMLAYVTQVPFT